MSSVAALSGRSASLAALALTLLTGLAHAQTTVSLGAIRGNTLYEDPQGSLSGASAEFLFAGRTNLQENALRRGLLQFDTSSIPAGSTITSVTLRMRMSRSITGTEPVTIHRVLGSWGSANSQITGQGGSGTPATPGDATWIHRFFDFPTSVPQGTFWNNPGGDFDANALATRNVSGIAFYNWTSAALTADVQRWVNNPSENFGLMIRSDEAGGGSAKRFDGPGSTTAANRPSLSITYIIPTPGAAAVLGLGVLAAGRRRR